MQLGSLNPFAIKPEPKAPPKPRAAAAPTIGEKQAKVIAALESGLRYFPGGESRLAEYTGIPVSDLNRLKDLRLEQVQVITPYLVDEKTVDDEWNFIRAPAVNLNAPMKRKPQSTMTASNPFFACLSDDPVDKVIELELGPRIDAAYLNALSLRVSREDERITFADADNGLVSTTDAAAYLRLYMQRLILSRDFAATLENATINAEYVGRAMELKGARGGVSHGGQNINGSGGFSFEFSYQAKGKAGRYLCGETGRTVANVLALTMARQRNPAGKIVVSPEIATKAYEIVRGAILGQGDVTVSGDEALQVVTARTLVTWKSRG